jgi:hypothetical protein
MLPLSKVLLSAAYAQRLRDTPERAPEFAYAILAQMVGVPNAKAQRALRRAAKQGYLTEIGLNRYTVTEKGYDEIKHRS